MAQGEFHFPLGERFVARVLVEGEDLCASDFAGFDLVFLGGGLALGRVGVFAAPFRDG